MTTIEKLVQAARSMTADDIKKHFERLREAEKRFEEEQAAKESDPQGFLNRQYTI